MKSKLLLFIKLLLIFVLVQACVVQPEDLFEAIASGDVKTVQQYIDSEQDLNIVNSDGKTAVFAAVESGNDDILKLLVYAGADTKTGNPFEYAINNKDLDSVCLLYEGSTNKLFEYAFSNRISWLAAGLIRSGVGVDLTTSREEEKANELLFFTIKHDLPDVALALLNIGVSWSQTDAHGNTPMALARERYSLNSNLLKKLKTSPDFGLVKQDFYGDWTPTGGYGPQMSFNADESCSLQFVKDGGGPGLAMTGKFSYSNVNGSSQIVMELTDAEVDDRYGDDWSPMTETLQINFLSKKRMELVFLNSELVSNDEIWIVSKKLTDLFSRLPADKQGFTHLMEDCADLDTSDLMWDWYYPDMTVEEINATDYYGRNALLWTQMYYPANIDIETIIRYFDFLIEKGIDLSCRDNDGKNIYDYIEALYYNKEDRKYLALIEFLEPYKDQINGAQEFGTAVLNTATSRFLNAENIPVESIQDIKMYYSPFGMPEDPGYWLQTVVEKKYMYNRTDKCFAFMDVTVNNSLKVTAISPTGREFTRQFSNDELAIYKSTNSYEEYEDYEGNPLQSPIRTFDLDIDIDFVPGDWRLKLYPDGASKSKDYSFDTRYSGGVAFGFQGSRSPFEPAGEITVPSGKKMIFAGKNLEPECSYKVGLFYKVGDNQETTTYTLRAKLAAYGETDSNGDFTLELDIQNDMTDEVYYMGDGQDEYSASWFLPHIVMDPAIAAGKKTARESESTESKIPERLTGSWENSEYGENHTNTTIFLSNTGTCIYKADKESPKHYGTFEYNEDETELVLYLVDPDGDDYQLKLDVVKYTQNQPMYNPDLDIEYTKID